MEDCIFCKIINGEIPSFKVYEDDQVLAFMDINPISPGHTLIIPKNHAANLKEISEADLAAVHKASKKVITGIETALNASGVACVQLNGRGVNQVVMHYHLHLIPKVPEGPDLPVSKWEIIPGDMNEIKGTAEKISTAIDNR
ncbi:MAG: HIT family protein [Deltaproteobacteria bacterium]|nr:HIT family protein [Deltaproteobacteria bacterium]